MDRLQLPICQLKTLKISLGILFVVKKNRWDFLHVYLQLVMRMRMGRLQKQRYAKSKEAYM